MNHVRTISGLFWGDTAYLALFVISVILLFCFRKKWKKIYEAYFYYIILLYALVLINPLVIQKLIETYFPGDAELVRLYIILPVGFLIAAVLTETVSMVKGNKKKLTVILILLFVIGLTGKGVLETGFYIKPQSIYKVNDDGREAADIMTADVKKDIDNGEEKADRYDSSGEYINTVVPVYLEAPAPLYNTTRLVMTEFTDGYEIKGKFERGGSYFFGIMCYADWKYIQAEAKFISDEEFVQGEELSGYDVNWLTTYYLPQFNQFTYITFENGSGELSSKIEETGLYKKIGETKNHYVILKKSKNVDTAK